MCADLNEAALLIFEELVGYNKKRQILHEARTVWLTIKHTDSLMWIPIWRESKEGRKRAKERTQQAKVF